MRKETMGKKRIHNRIWKALAAFGVMFILGGCHTETNVDKGAKRWEALNQTMPSLALENWLDQRFEKNEAFSDLLIVSGDTFECLEINLAKKSADMKFVQVRGKVLKIGGRIDREYGYFEGTVTWSGEEIYIVNFATKEYALLQENIRSFMNGDYYVFTGYHPEKEEMELIIFDCS